MKRDIKGILDNGTIVASAPGTFEAIDGATGRLKWSLATKASQNSAPAIMTARGSLLIADSEAIYCVDPEKGDVQLTIKVDKGVKNLCLSDDESVIYAETFKDGSIEALDFRTPEETAQDMLDDGSSDPTAPDDSTVDINDDYIIIDDIKLPRRKQARSQKGENR